MSVAPIVNKKIFHPIEDLEFSLKFSIPKVRNEELISSWAIYSLFKVKYEIMEMTSLPN